MANFTIENAGSPEKRRLIASQVLTVADFDAIAAELSVTPIQARKTGFVAARLARERTGIETRWNGTETTNIAEPGDWIVTNMTPDRELMRDGEGRCNAYVIRSAEFSHRYAADAGTTSAGDVYRALGKVEAILFCGGFEIVGPWGAVQRSDAGYLLRNGADVYGNAKETFEATYLVE